ncbi:thiopurine S-methyltransferase [Pseudomonas sp. MTM4]|uniref:thiopurine S-methyltransferase n=1 Tax=unclassified Pseudomonas TaxID=196821 RepID=UPI0018D25FD2|nr:MULTISPECIES: thiopurine S-methyltransferase [unclassified Pseudomonas]MBC8651730.1 thiopurine S-methyltransferase [Pseudomonas sp. MT4]QXY91367.1 thiopurine S-methyltransferase [Pseudomonas sp. MTM4]
MDEGFWQRRWARNEIGFHLNEVNPYLRRHWPGMQLAEGARVLVPLCGKSLDMLWLVAQGFAVLGVELSERAVEVFFTEQGLDAEISTRGEFKVYRAGALEIRCGDFFALSSSDVADCDGLYDRAALIALPAAMRQRYVEHLTSILAPSCQGLLITLDYEQEQMSGPPFAVSDAEVRRSLGSRWDVELLERANVLDGNWKFLQRGLSRLEETCYRLGVRR